MAAAGELVPGPFSGRALEPAPPPPSGGRGPFGDFVRHLRSHLAPPPPDELGWQAVAGVGLILIAAALLWLLPSAETIGGADLLKWVGRAGLASTLGWAGSFAGPLALFAVAALLSIGAIYWRQLGAQPALIFLSAQPWLAVLALVVPVGVWLYLLLILVVNLVFWAVWIAVFTIVSVAGLAGAFRLLGALAQ